MDSDNIEYEGVYSSVDDEYEMDTRNFVCIYTQGIPTIISVVKHSWKICERYTYMSFYTRVYLHLYAGVL